MEIDDDKVIPITRKQDRELENIAEYWRNHVCPPTTTARSLFGISPTGYDLWKSNDASNCRPISMNDMLRAYKIAAGMPLLEIVK